MTGIVFQDVGRRAQLSTWLAAACFILGAWLLLPAPASAQTGPQRLPVIPLGAGMHIIKAEVARTPREHEIGLMFRESMGLNEGMLFIFAQAAPQCFWMKNTLIPLSIAFIADDGTIVNVDEMKPQTLETHCSHKPVRFVLEMNTGWFGKHGFKAGSQLTGAPFGNGR